MQMLYNSDTFVVLQFDLSAEAVPVAARHHRGFEIVNKPAGREVYIDGHIAASFRRGVQALLDRESAPADFDEFIGRYTLLAQQPVTMH